MKFKAFPLIVKRANPSLKSPSLLDSATHYWRMLPTRLNLRRITLGVLAIHFLLPVWVTAQNPGVTLSRTDLSLHEGTTATYTVVLKTAPTATVTISIAASDDVTKCLANSGVSCTRKSGVASVNPTRLTFTTTNWSQVQTVTVTANDESMAGNFKFAKTTHSVSGGNYDGVTAPEVLITVVDNDDVGIHYQIGQPGQLQTRSKLLLREGSVGAYYVSLRSEPTAATTLTLASQNSHVTVTPQTFTFTSDNWNQPKRISVSVIEDGVVILKVVKVKITSTFSGAGSDYAAREVHHFTVNVINETVRGNLYYIGAPGQLRERYSLGIYEGSGGAFYASLASRPTATTTLTLASEDARVTVSPLTLTFTASNWNQPQKVSIAVADNHVIGESRVQIEIDGTFSGAGSDYANVQAISFTVNIFSNDQPGKTVDRGKSITHHVKLNYYDGPITVVGETTDETIASITPSEILVTPTNFRALPFTLTGVKGGQNYVNFWYGQLLLRSFELTVVDNTTLSVDANPVCGTKVTDLSAQYTYSLVLEPPPDSDVDTEYRWVTDHSAGRWLGTHSPIRPSGRSIKQPPDNTFGQLRGAFAGFRGFEFRLKNDPDITALCTWQIEDAETSPTVRLTAAPNPVHEGSSVTVTATLSKALTENITVPIILTHGSAEDGDYGSLGSITIPSGRTTSTGAITTSQDADADDETFTAALGNLPASVTMGSPSLVEVTIRDNNGDSTTPTPSVWLSAYPNPVEEGATVTVMVQMSTPAPSQMSIPLTFTDITAESDDHGTLPAITIPTGQTTAESTITTTDDADTSDETFMVALGTLPTTVQAGNPSSRMLRILDDDGLGTIPTIPMVSLSVSPNPVEEGEEVTVTASLSIPLSIATTIPLTLTSDTAEDDDYGSLASITIAGGSESGEGTITTYEDEDVDEEIFIVALGNLPASVVTGFPHSVAVSINDDGDKRNPRRRRGRGGTPSNRPPTVVASCDPCTVAPEREVQLAAEATDPDGDTLTYTWSTSLGNFTGRTDEASAHWQAPSETGSVEVDVQVSDGRGGQVSDTVTIQVVNAPPKFAASMYTFELREGVPGDLKLGAVVAEDPEGGKLTCALENGRADRFKVGAFDGTVTYTGPGEDYETQPNQYEITVSARDPYGAEAHTQVMVMVTNVNEPPKAVADSSQTPEDTEVEIDVLANDSDVEDDPLTIESVSPPTNGTARIVEESVIYTPDADWYGTDQFLYTVTDGYGGTATAAIEIVVESVNDAPLSVDDSSQTMEDTEVEIDVLANDSDVDDDSLRVESVSSPTNGRARATGHSVIYTPAAEWHGTDRFLYAVEDGHGGTASAEVVVVVIQVNDVPEALPDTALTAEDQRVVIDVLANDSDIERDTLSVESVSAPAHGSARVAARIALDQRGSVVIYAPDADWHGTDRFDYTVTDGNGGTATAQVEVIVQPVNDAPMAMADLARTLEDTEVEIDVLANDTDIDGDALRVESVSVPAHGSVQIAAQIAMDRPVGIVIYAPDANWHGTDSFVYTMSDGNGGLASGEVQIEVESDNDAPMVVSAIPDQTLDEGGTATRFDLEPYFVDPDGDPLTYTAWSSDPGVVAVTVAVTTMTMIPVGYGEVSIQITARDPWGLDASQTFPVGSSDWMVQLVLDETFAAMARAHLASARMTLGRRVGPTGIEAGSSLTIMGQRIPLNRENVRETAGQLLESWALSHLRRNGRLSESGRSFEDQIAAQMATAESLNDSSNPVELAAALGVGNLGRYQNPGGLGTGGTEWVLVFGDQKRSAHSGGVWRFWGQGDIQTFEGEPSSARNYTGDLRTGWVGLDRTFGQHWLLGLAVTQSSGRGDWRTGNAHGQLKTSLTAAQPYLRWSDGVTSLWAIGGSGQGSVQNARGLRDDWEPADTMWTAPVGKSNLQLHIGLFEVRRKFTNWLGIRADAAWARLTTDTGHETIDGRSAEVDQQRLGIELSPITRLGVLAIEPFAEASARRDGGTGQTGSGLEVSSGLRVANGFVRVDARGRMLVHHSASGYKERGFGVTLTMGKLSAEEGFSMSIAHHQGTSANTTGALWSEHYGAPSLGKHTGDVLRTIDARCRWATHLSGGRVLTWTGGVTRSDRDYAFTISGGIKPGGQVHRSKWDSEKI